MLLSCFSACSLSCSSCSASVAASSSFVVFFLCMLSSSCAASLSSASFACPSSYHHSAAHTHASDRRHNGATYRRLLAATYFTTGPSTIMQVTAPLKRPLTHAAWRSLACVSMRYVVRHCYTAMYCVVVFACQVVSLHVVVSGQRPYIPTVSAHIHNNIHQTIRFQPARAVLRRAPDRTLTDRVLSSRCRC